MVSRFATMSILAVMGVVGIGAYNQALSGLGTEANNSDILPVLTSVGDPVLQLIPLVIFGLLAVSVAGALGGLPR
jgi:hypothetical protein